MIKAFVFDAYGTLFDVQSVADVVEAAFPGFGEFITQLWRQKQLEYSWLRSLGDCYADFAIVTRESLIFSLQTLGKTADDALLDTLADAYNYLRPYPDAEICLQELSHYRRAIFSNGSPAMLSTLIGNSSLAPHLERTISVDSKRVFKPDPRAYQLIEEQMGVRPDEVLFVSSNGFDICGAKQFGFNVVRVERLAPAILARHLTGSAGIGPKTMFNAMRLQQETYGAGPDHVVGALKDVPGLAAQF